MLKSVSLNPTSTDKCGQTMEALYSVCISCLTCIHWLRVRYG